MPPWAAMFDDVLSVNAINSRQQIVGRRECGERQHAALIEVDHTQDLLEHLNDFSSEATDINDNGMIVGTVRLLESARALPFIWHNGNTTLLQDPRLAAPIALNNRNQVLLEGTTEAGGDFLWEDGSLVAIGQGLNARGLDDAGRVVGETLVDSPEAGSGFVWEGGLVSEHAEFASIHRSNSSGQLAGVMPNGRSAFWDGESLVALPENFGLPLGLNDHGIVLGGAEPSRIYDQGVVARLTGDFYDLYALDISQNDDIVAMTMVIEDNGFRPCRMEACEYLHYYSAVWSNDCYGTCCNQGGAGGGSQQSGAGAGGTTN